MARKKPHEEHENHERWMVSYADFLTLLFATFVVLYALSQISLAEFKDMEVGIKQAFSPPSLFKNDKGILDSGKDILKKSPTDSMIDSLMLEYVSPTYEQDAFKQIKEEVEALTKKGELDGITATIDERGLVIKISDKNILFKSASAELSKDAYKKLDMVGKLIIQKFAMHNIRIEGHTDSLPISGDKYPSNWELSSARASAIVRYLINKFKFTPDLFSAVGLSDTRPIDSAKTNEAYAKNRRVEIIVLRNQNKKIENSQDSFIKMSKTQQQEIRNSQIQAVKQLENSELEEIEKRIEKTQKEASQNTVNEYMNEANRLNKIK